MCFDGLQHTTTDTLFIRFNTLSENVRSHAERWSLGRVWTPHRSPHPAVHRTRAPLTPFPMPRDTSLRVLRVLTGPLEPQFLIFNDDTKKTLKQADSMDAIKNAQITLRQKNAAATNSSAFDEIASRSGVARIGPRFLSSPSRL